MFITSHKLRMWSTSNHVSLLFNLQGIYVQLCSGEPRRQRKWGRNPSWWNWQAAGELMMRNTDLWIKDGQLIMMKKKTRTFGDVGILRQLMIVAFMRLLLELPWVALTELITLIGEMYRSEIFGSSCEIRLSTFLRMGTLPHVAVSQTLKLGKSDTPPLLVRRSHRFWKYPNVTFNSKLNCWWSCPVPPKTSLLKIRVQLLLDLKDEQVWLRVARTLWFPKHPSKEGLKGLK